MLATPPVAKIIGDLAIQENLLSHLPNYKHGGATVSITSAVVDALPSHQPGLSNKYYNAIGSDGLAILLSSEKPSTDDDCMEARGVDEEEAHLDTLVFSSNSPFRNRQGIVIGRGIELPVANTIFVNGNRTTMFRDTWHYEPLEGETTRFVHDARYVPSKCHVRMRCDYRAFFRGSAIPLQSLTPSRQVISAMGNVIAQIQVDDRTEPASQELEKVVPGFIQQHPLSTASGPLMVYALIRPSQSFKPSQKAGVNASSLIHALWHGARLFKVSGGGGGWGKRAGLLSLEPAIDFRPSQTEALINSIDLDGGDDLVDKLSSNVLVPPGSHVEFFACPDPSAQNVELPPRNTPVEQQVDWDGPVEQTVILGTRLDPVSGDVMPDTREHDGASVTFIPNVFGMLSYGGAALQVREKDTHVKREHVPGPRTPPEKRTKALTRLDVPGATFALSEVWRNRSEDRSNILDLDAVAADSENTKKIDESRP
jgi:hypothetical protein